MPSRTEFSPDSTLGLLHIPSSYGIVSGESFDRLSNGETMQIGQHNPLNLSLHVSTAHGRRKSEPSYDHIFKSELNRQEFNEKQHLTRQRASPEAELDTPALTYLATPSTTFSHDTPLFVSPVDSTNSPRVASTFSPVSTFAGLESHPGDVKPLTGKLSHFDALGLFQASETCETSVCSHDGGGKEEGTVHHGIVLNKESFTMSVEQTQDIFSELWKSRRPKDCRIFFQAPRLCYLNGTVCPSCKHESLVGSYQCATTMKPFPQASIDALLRRPSGERRTAAQKNTQKRISRSLARTGSAYPLSGPLPYLHPITTLEVCLLCTTEECSTKEFKMIDRVDFMLPLQDVNYQIIFRGLLFADELLKEDPYDGLFDEPGTL